MWPAMIVQQLFSLLPKGYNAEPGVHLGSRFEIDVSTFEENSSTETTLTSDAGNGGVATIAPPEPTLTLETDFPDQDEFEVRVYNVEFGRRLVAAIEIVSPPNKDRPESRRAFVAKVAALIQKDVCVSIVDLVTTRQFNLYADFLELLDANDPQLGSTPPELYSVTLRSRKPPKKRSLLDTWYYSMTVGKPLPTLPIWLDVDLCVMLPLEPGYEETCRLLRIA